MAASVVRNGRISISLQWTWTCTAAIAETLQIFSPTLKNRNSWKPNNIMKTNKFADNFNKGSGTRVKVEMKNEWVWIFSVASNRSQNFGISVKLLNRRASRRGKQMIPAKLATTILYVHFTFKYVLLMDIVMCSQSEGLRWLVTQRYKHKIPHRV